MPQPPVMPEGCPWSGYTPPNVDWCEAELCSWVSNPANTWSNLAYLVLGLLMWHHARKTEHPSLKLFAPASVVVGVFSGVYHASVTHFLQFFDFVGMFVFAFLVLTLNSRRLGWISARRQVAFYALGVLIFSALVPPLFRVGVPIQGLVAVLIVVALAQEVKLWRTGPHGLFLLSLGLLIAGAIFSALDLSRRFCDPDDHIIQGHAIWHLLTAASLYALYHFYARVMDRYQGRDSEAAA